MTDYIASGTDLTSVADAIRTKGGTSSSLAFPNGFVSAINDISGGGGIQGGYNVKFTTEGNDYAIVSCVAGNSIDAPLDPVISGKAFTGWYNGASKISFPYTPSADITLTAGLVTAETCTVTGLGSSNPSSVTFTKSSGWSDTYETIVKDGDTFKKFPTMWRKVNTTASGQITSWTIATAQIDSSYQVYPCFLAEDGTTVLPYVLMGVSCSNANNVCNSIAGYTGSVSQTISKGRTNARARGIGYQLMDWMIFKLWQDLLCVAMQTINTNSGSEITTDRLGVYWGTYYIWVDGVARNSTNWIYSYKPTSYADSPTSSTTNYQQCTYSTPSWSSSTSECISKLGYDSGNPFFNYPNAMVTDSNYASYYCDAVYGSTSTTNSPVFSRVGGAYADGGAFVCGAGNAWSSALGVRLCYRPLSA